MQLIERFSKVFMKLECNTNQLSHDAGPVISRNQNEMLTAELTFTEFIQAVKIMHPDKASGPDGLNPAFFQHFWNMVGKEVFKCCQHWLVECMLSAEVNDTTLVLIPKKNGDDPKDLRPVALCNVLYKIVAKVLENKLQKILPRVISEE